MPVQLTVIDQTPVHGDRPAQQAPYTSLELAKAGARFAISTCRTVRGNGMVIGVCQRCKRYKYPSMESAIFHLERAFFFRVLAFILGSHSSMVVSQHPK